MGDPEFTRPGTDPLKERLDELEERISELAQQIGNEHAATQIITNLFKAQATSAANVEAMLARQIKRGEMTAMLTGYMWAALEEIRTSGQISPSIEQKLDKHLEHVRPLMAEIMGVPTGRLNGPETPQDSAGQPPG